ncbi:MAG: 5'-3' exonuclease H3TH domain-containing protein [Acidimicrobiales bacterium]|nr:5'-3' exonuclease H3TH domain-containing protein [Acidimicrobiales bacterium]
MQVHLIDGTYELFRHFYAVPSHVTGDGREVGAVRAVVGSMLMLLEDGATHVAVATDKVIESFRNDLWPTYKDGSGVDPVLLSQFRLLEDTLTSAGFAVYAMVDHEADDALASLAKTAAADPQVDRVLVATPDKDLAQCVVDDRIVQYDRRKGTISGVAEVIDKFGVPPESIPDWLALVGDTADGFPGVPGWGAKSAATVLARWGHVEAIPDDPAEWDVTVRGAARLATTLAEHRENALLFRRLATLVDDLDLVGSVDELRWAGPRSGFAEVAAALDAPGLAERAEQLAERRD